MKGSSRSVLTEFGRTSHKEQLSTIQVFGGKQGHGLWSGLNIEKVVVTHGTKERLVIGGATAALEGFELRVFTKFRIG
jgi:hypothetical protein